MANRKTEAQKAVKAAALAEVEQQESSEKENQDITSEQIIAEKGQVDGTTGEVPTENDNGVPVECEGLGAQMAPEDGCSCLPQDIYYVPTELRTKLEKTATKMLDNLVGYSGEYNDAQLRQVSMALDIYSRIRG